MLEEATLCLGLISSPSSPRLSPPGDADRSLELSLGQTLAEGGEVGLGLCPS